MTDHKNMKLDDNAMEVATGGINIIAGLDEHEVVQVAAKVVELSGVPSSVKTLVKIATANDDKETE